MIRNILICFILLCISSRSFTQTDTIPKVASLLNLSLEELMNVKVVTASGYLQTISEAPSTITVITAEQIAARGYEQLEDALRDIPGIDMIHINGYAPTLFYFRGMYGAENLRALLMIDGIVENNILGSNDMAGPAYSLHNAERIEIVWGPVSALYGANAFGGVINIISKKGQDIDGLKAQQGFGSFNTSFTKLMLGTKKNNWEFAVAGTLYTTDGPRFTNRDPNYSGSYVGKAYSFNAALSYHLKKSKTTIGFRTYRTPMGWGTYSNSPTQYLQLPPQGNSNIGSVGVMSRNFRGERSGLDEPYLRTLYIENEYKSSEKLNFLSRIVYRETGIADNSYIYITVDARRMIRAMIGSYSNRVSGEFLANYSPSSHHRFTAGLQFLQDNVEAGARKANIDLNTTYLVDGRDTVVNLNSTYLPRDFDIRNNFGSFLQYNLNTELAGKTNFTFGFRYDKNSYFGDAFSPRIAIVNQPSEKLSFKLQFGKAFRAPTNLEIYQARNNNFPLKQEQLKAYELNAIYMVSKNIRVQLNGFRNDLTDVIILGNLSGLSPDKNPGIIHVNGLEAILDMAFEKNISSFINFTFQDSRGKNLVSGISGKLPGVARLKGNAGLTWHFTELFTISISGNWVGERRAPRTDPYGPVSGYFLTNCTLSTIKLFKEKITASLNIHNIFNVKWLDPGFRTADGLVYSTVLEQPGINGIFKVGINL
ncbi:MAG: TonB-dependent receptor [Chitinophagaceae bacterium]